MFLKRSSRQKRGKRKSSHLRVLQNTFMFWSVSQNLIKTISHALLAVFFVNKKRFKKTFSKTDRRLVVIITLIFGIWLNVAIVWPTRTASSNLINNLPRLATDKDQNISDNTINQQIEGETLVFELKNPLTTMQVSQEFRSNHLAIDLATDYGAEIKPVATGIVERAGWDPYGKGKIVLVNHGQNLKTLYAHLSKINVIEGGVVDQDKVIGNVGTTGHSTGAHLHLEVLDNNELVDPAHFLENNLTDL